MEEAKRIALLEKENFELKEEVVERKYESSC